MKYTAIPISIIAVYFAKIAEAIVIVPPIIYVASFSVGTFVLNTFMMTAVYMAGRGLVDRFYHGKQLHEIVGIAFSYLGYIFVIIATAFISIAIFDPIDARSLFYASVFSTFLSFLVMALNNFRKYTLTDPHKRDEVVLPILVFSVIVFIITFVSAYFSISTSIIKKQDVPIKTMVSEDVQNTPSADFGINFEASKKTAGEYKKQDTSAALSETREDIWFYPFMNGICEIYAGGRLIKAEMPSGKCFYYDNSNNTKRMICPIYLTFEELSRSQINKNVLIQIEGKGSCLDGYKVYISESGLKYVQ